MRINFKFLLICFAIAASLILVGFLLHRVQVNKTSDVILNLASEAADNNEPREAIALYRRYLGLQPNDASARAKLGTLLARSGAVEPAFFELERALRTDPTLDEDRQELVKVSMSLGRFADARTHLNRLISDHPDDAELHWLLGYCDLEKNDFDAAKQDFRRAFESDKQNPAYASDLANLLTDQFSEVAAANKVLDDLVESTPESADAYVVRGRWLFKRANAPRSGNKETRKSIYEQAWSDAQRATELEPTSVSAVALAVDIALATDRSDQVRQLVSDALEKEPQTIPFYSNAASIEMRTGNQDKAIAVLKKGLQVNPGQLDLIWSLALLEATAGNMDEVEKLANDLDTEENLETRVGFLRAQVYAARGEWREAIKSIDKVRSRLGRDKNLLKRAELLIAGCYEKLGKDDQQIVALERAIDADPLWPRGRQALASALLRTGKVQRSLAEFRVVLQQPDPPLSAVVSFARLTFLDTLRRGEKDPDWKPLESILKKLDEYPDAADDVAILKAEKLFVEEDFDAAQSLLEDQLKASPRAFPLYQALIALHIEKKQWEEAEEILKTAEESLPDSPQLRLEKARLMVRRDGESLNLSALDSIFEPASSWSVEEQVKLAKDAARLFLSLEEFDRSEEQAGRVAETEIGRNDLDIHLLIFDLANRSKNSEQMSESLLFVKKIEGQGPLWRVGEATSLTVKADNLEDGDPEKAKLYRRALEHLTKAAADRPEWGRIPRFQGEIYDRQTQNDLAVKHYLRAIDLGEQNLSMVARLIGLLYSQERFVETDALIRKLQERQTPFSSELTQLASQVSLELQDFDRAVELAKSGVKETDTQADQLWLAQIYRIIGQEEEARKQLRKTIDMDPSKPAPWIAMVQLMAQSGDIDDATDLIEEAKSAIAQEERPNALGQAYESIKDYPQAEQYYRQALNTTPDDASTIQNLARLYLETEQENQARPLLERLADSQGQSNLSARTWARRNLALSFDATESKAFKDAQSLLAANRRELGPTIEDQRALAVIYAYRSDSASLQQAISVLEKLIADQSTYSVSDNALLSDLYLRRGRRDAKDDEVFSTMDWSRYNRTMRSVLSNGGEDNPEIVQRHIDALTAMELLADARLWQNRLKKLAPDQLMTLTIEARLFYLSEDYDRLLSLLESKADSSTTLLWAAQGAEAFGLELRNSGKDQEAKRLLQRAGDWFAAASTTLPESEYAQVGFYARIGEIDQALLLLNDKSASSEILADVAQQALQSNRLTAVQAKSLLTLLEPAFDQTDPDPIIGLIVGDLHTWRGDWQNAMSAYLRVLKTDERNLPALNNLAYVLAHTGQRLDVATDAIETAFEGISPPDALFDTRGSVLLAMSDFKKAEANFRVAIQSRATPSRLMHLAQSLYEQGAVDDARSAMEKALSAGAKRENIHPIEKPTFDRLNQQLQPLGAKPQS